MKEVNKEQEDEVDAAYSLKKYIFSFRTTTHRLFESAVCQQASARTNEASYSTVHLTHQI